MGCGMAGKQASTGVLASGFRSVLSELDRLDIHVDPARMSGRHQQAMRACSARLDQSGSTGLPGISDLHARGPIPDILH